MNAERTLEVACRARSRSTRTTTSNSVLQSTGSNEFSDLSIAWREHSKFSIVSARAFTSDRVEGQCFSQRRGFPVLPKCLLQTSQSRHPAPAETALRRLLPSFRNPVCRTYYRLTIKSPPFRAPVLTHPSHLALAEISQSIFIKHVRHRLSGKAGAPPRTLLADNLLAYP